MSIRIALLLPLLLVSAPVLAQDRAAVLECLAQADLNHDGQITRDELIRSRAANFQRFDRNGDGVLTLDDVPRLLLNTSMGNEFKALLAQFDANRDGKMTRDEFVNGPTVFFDLADGNHNNVVTQAELQAAIAQARAAKGR